jgi:glycosyltransferase involved in cell wall biosynthesis
MSVDLREVRRPGDGAAEFPSSASSPPRLRIAIVAPPWYPIPPPAYGGIEAVCGLLADGLVGAGHDVSLIGAGASRSRARFWPTFDEPPTGLGTASATWVELTHGNRAAALIEELRPDLVHDHSLAGPLTAWGRSAPTVATVHGPATGLTQTFLTSLPADVALVAISRAQRAAAPTLPWAATIHNAIRPEDFEFNPSTSDTCLFMGRMNPDKGAHLAIDVARRAGRPIVLAGKCEEPLERAYFQTEILPRLGPDTEWIGEADMATKGELYSQAGCLISPLQWDEPFGLVMLEAMASGTPVIALRRGAVPEVVVDGVTGFVREDLDGLVSAVSMLDRIDRAACREHVERNFDPAVMVASYERVYQTIVGRLRVASTRLDRGR